MPQPGVGEDEVGLVGFHRLELLLGVGNGIASVFLDEVLAEAEAAAVTAFGIINHFAAPSLNHASQHVRELRVTDAVLRENLGIMATDMLHPAQRFAREAVNQLVLHLLFQIETEFENQIRRVDDVLGNLKRASRGLEQVLAGFFQNLGLFLPLLQQFGHHTERGNTRGYIVFVTALSH